MRPITQLTYTYAALFDASGHDPSLALHFHVCISHTRGTPARSVEVGSRAATDALAVGHDTDAVAQPSRAAAEDDSLAESTTARLALGLVRTRASGELEWAPRALEKIAATLEAELEAGAGARALDELLRLMAVLRHEHASPEAADGLGAVIGRIPAARAVVRGRLTPSGGIDKARDFAQREGRASRPAAPSSHTPIPAGAVPARALLDTQSIDKARALGARPRKDRNHG